MMVEHAEPADETPADETPLGELERVVGEQLEELESLVREHPLATFGIAVGVGALAALILSRR